MWKAVCDNPHECQCKADVQFEIYSSGSPFRACDIALCVYVSHTTGRTMRATLKKVGNMEIVKVTGDIRINVRRFVYLLMDYHSRVAGSFTYLGSKGYSRQTEKYIANLLTCIPCGFSESNLIVPYKAVFIGPLVYCGGVWPRFTDRRRILADMDSIGAPIETVCEFIEMSSYKRGEKK